MSVNYREQTPRRTPEYVRLREVPPCKLCIYASRRLREDQRPKSGTHSSLDLHVAQGTCSLVVSHGLMRPMVRLGLMIPKSLLVDCDVFCPHCLHITRQNDFSITPFVIPSNSLTCFLFVLTGSWRVKGRFLFIFVGQKKNFIFYFIKIYINYLLFFVGGGVGLGGDGKDHMVCHSPSEDRWWLVLNYCVGVG